MNKFQKKINVEVKKLSKIIQNSNLPEIKNFDKLCHLSINAIKKNKKIIFFGNGGSAADAQHLATEFTVKYKKKRRALPAISLATDTSALTAIGNDLNFKYIFSRQIEAVGNSGDIAIGITTSGNSRNMIEGIKAANKKKIITFCFSGNNGGKIKKVVKYPIIIPSKDTSITQILEILIGQVYCENIEEYFSK